MALACASVAWRVFVLMTFDITGVDIPAELQCGLPSSSSLQLVRLETPSRNDLQRIGIAFKCYHTHRLGHSDMVTHAIRLASFDRVHELLLADPRQFADEVSLCDCASH